MHGVLTVQTPARCDEIQHSAPAIPLRGLQLSARADYVSDAVSGAFAPALIKRIQGLFANARISFKTACMKPVFRPQASRSGAAKMNPTQKFQFI